jgi:hypothetical protein
MNGPADNGHEKPPSDLLRTIARAVLLIFALGLVYLAIKGIMIVLSRL